MRSLLIPQVLAIVCLSFVAGCGDDQQPEEAQLLWDKIHSQKYQSWTRAPGYETRRASNAPHGDEVDIYINPTIEQTLTAGPITSWPVGSLIVKDGFSGSDLSLVAAMEKRDGGWFWAEWDEAGDASYSGSPETCTSCHQSGSDFVRAFGFPQ